MNKALIIILTAVILSSCGSQKSLTRPADTGDASSSVATQTRAAAGWSDNTYNPLTAVSAAANWTDFSANGNLSLSGTSSLSSAIQVKMSRGRFISISLRPILGIEMGKLYVDRDSITIIDKYHNLYVREDVSKLAGSNGGGLIALQNLLLARPFDLKNGDIAITDIAQYSATAPDSDGRWTLTPPASVAALVYVFQMLADNVSRIDITVADRDNYSLSFSDYRTTDGRVSPGRIQADLSLASADAAITIEMSKSIRWNSGVSDNVRIPSDARRYSLAQIIKLLTK